MRHLQHIDEGPGLYTLWVEAFTQVNGYSPYDKPPQSEPKDTHIMNHVIPNPAQVSALTEIYQLRYPTKNIAILASGLVVHRRPKSGNKIIGQVIVINGWFSCFIMEGNQHECIWEATLDPAPSEMDLLKARVTELEKLVL